MLRARPETYGTHKVAAAPGTHQAIADLVAANVDRQGKLLDLGAYTGALISRLRDRGFGNVLAADLSNHLTEEVDHIWLCDLNTPISETIDQHDIDCITAAETIEHLDDPRAFLRQCRALLKPGGKLVISTPNIGFFEGRIKFLLTGEMWGFGAKNYRSQRHISAISMGQMPLMLEECGFSCDAVLTTASFATPLRRLLTAPLWLPMRAAFGPQVLGESLVCLATAKVVEGAIATPGTAAWTSSGEPARQVA